MASRPIPAPSNNEHDEQKPSAKTASLRKIARLIEEHMTQAGFSEEEKNKRVQQFGKRVDRAVSRRRAKRA